MRKYEGSLDGWVVRVFRTRTEAYQWAATKPEAKIKMLRDEEKEKRLEEIRNAPEAVF